MRAACLTAAALAFTLSPQFYHPGREYNVRVASRYFKGPELLVDLQASGMTGQGTRRWLAALLVQRGSSEVAKGPTPVATKAHLAPFCLLAVAWFTPL